MGARSGEVGDLFLCEVVEKKNRRDSHSVNKLRDKN